MGSSLASTGHRVAHTGLLGDAAKVAPSTGQVLPLTRAQNSQKGSGLGFTCYLSLGQELLWTTEHSRLESLNEGKLRPR